MSAKKTPQIQPDTQPGKPDAQPGKPGSKDPNPMSQKPSRENGEKSSNRKRKEACEQLGGDEEFPEQCPAPLPKSSKQ